MVALRNPDQINPGRQLTYFQGNTEASSIAAQCGSGHYPVSEQVEDFELNGSGRRLQTHFHIMGGRIGMQTQLQQWITEMGLCHGSGSKQCE